MPEQNIRALSSKKRVLMVHNFYQIDGGEHTVFYNELNLLRNHEHDVFEYTRSNNELKESKLKLFLSPISAIWSLKTYRDIKESIKKWKIDIVHCHNTFPLISPSVYYAARKCGVPVVQTVHNFRFICPNGVLFCKGHICELCREKRSFKDAIKNKCYRGSRIQTLIVVAMLKIHRAIGTYNRINYIFLTEFNKKKFKDFVDAKHSMVKKARKTKFIYAGRLEENKGILSLIDMWGSLPENYELHIYGEGACREKVKEKICGHDNITYFGLQERWRVAEDQIDSIATIVPSECYETFGMAIPECFSNGIPVIATKLGNLRDMLEESKGGEVYEIGNTMSFQNAVEKVVNNYEEYANNAYLFYMKYLTSEENYKRLIEIYDKAR